MKARISVILSRCPVLFSIIVSEGEMEIFVYGTHDEIAKFINKFSSAFLETFPPDLSKYKPEFSEGNFRLDQPDTLPDAEHTPKPATPEIPTEDNLFLR